MKETDPKRPTRWWRFSDEPPTPRFLRRVRIVILIMWAVVLIFGIPEVVSETKRILAYPPSEIRRAALETLVIESIATLIVAPFVVRAIFGFGAFPRNIVSVWSYGGPPIVPLWRSSRKRRTSGKREGDS